MSIELIGIHKSFGGRAVLRDFTASITGPTVLMGPSGCGKTTLLRIMMGLESLDSGLVRGVNRDKPVAAVFQEDRLCPGLTAVENICLTAGGLPSACAREELVALGFTQEDLLMPAARLSGGQRRRAALLRALLCRRAEVLLLDEPFTGMDAELVLQAAAAIMRLVGKRDCLLVTHDGMVAQRLQWPLLRMEKNK